MKHINYFFCTCVIAISFPIANCQLPIANLGNAGKAKIGNWQSEIGNFSVTDQTAALAPPPVTSPAEKAAIQAFEGQVKDFVELRNKVRAQSPKLSKDSTPEQIHAYRTTLEESLRTARKGARRGDLFLPDITAHIRRTLKKEFQGKDRKEIRDIAFETELQGVVLRVNYPYAQSAEVSEMPATLLSKLPQLPNEVRYRFVGTNLILVDRESNVIIDFMPKALP